MDVISTLGNGEWPTKASQTRAVVERKDALDAVMRSDVRFTHIADRLHIRTSERWGRAKAWGDRIFHFWCHRLGIGITVHETAGTIPACKDSDEAEMARSGVLALHVILGSEPDAARVALVAKNAATWTARRARLKMRTINGGE